MDMLMYRAQIEKAGRALIGTGFVITLGWRDQHFETYHLYGRLPGEERDGRRYMGDGKTLEAAAADLDAKVFGGL